MIICICIHRLRTKQARMQSWKKRSNIYTPSVFCYDEHKKNFDIHFSMKKHTWRMSRLLRRLFWIPPFCVFKNGYFIAKTGKFCINIRIEFYLFVSHGGMKDRGSTCKFRKALRDLHDKQTSRIQSLNSWENLTHYYLLTCRIVVNMMLWEIGRGNQAVGQYYALRVENMDEMFTAWYCSTNGISSKNHLGTQNITLAGAWDISSQLGLTVWLKRNSYFTF